MTAIYALSKPSLINCVPQRTPGRKVVHLYDPWQTAHLRPRGRDVLPIEASVRSCGSQAAATCERFREAERSSVELGAGDSLFIPAGYWHEVFTPRPTIATNCWLETAACARLRPSMLYLRSDAVLAALDHCDTAGVDGDDDVWGKHAGLMDPPRGGQ